MLMEYVGWKNINSAMRYLESNDPFNKQYIESKLQFSTALLVTDKRE